MNKNLLLGSLFFVAFNFSGLTQTKNIVINENTYNKLTAPGVNHMRMANKADEQKGIIRVKDSPHERLMFEKLRSQNPSTGKLPIEYRKRELQFLFDNQDVFRSRTKAQNIDWQQTGPYNVGGRTRALAVDVTNDNIILAAGVTGGMWRTEDGGQTWTKTTSLNDHQSVTAVAQDPRNGNTNIWYYATGELIGSSASATGAFYSGVGVFKSVNGGESWTKLSATDTDDTPIFTETTDICWNICVDPLNGDVYLASYGKIWRLTESGNTATTVLTSKPTDNDDWAATTDILCTPNGIKYATLSSEGTIHGLYRSVSGNTGEWTEITPVAFPSSFDRTVLAYAPSNENILYFLSETPGAGINDHSIWKLTINGNEDSWEDRSGNLPAKEDTGDNDVSGFESQNSYDLVIKVAPDDENMVFIGGTNLFRSDDAFSSSTNTVWIGGYATENNVSQYNNHHADQHAMAFLNNGQTLISGHDGGLSKTVDYKKKDTDTTPVDWTSLNKGYLTTQAYTVGIDANNTESFKIISGFQDNGSWSAIEDAAGLYQRDWVQVGSGDGAFCSVHTSKESIIASSQKGRVFLQYDDNSWSRIDPDGVDSDNLLFINPYEIDGNNETIMYYAGGTDIWRNNDIYSIPKFSNSPATIGWTKLSNTNVAGQISAIESSVTPANILYYGTSEGQIFKVIGANSGQPTSTQVTGSIMPAAYVSSIELNPTNANEVLASFSNYEVESIFQSLDGGDSWTAVSGNLEIINPSDNKNIGPSVRYVNILDIANTENDPIYFAGTSIGLYQAEELNSNTQWTQIATDKIGNTVVNMVKTRQDGFIAVGTHGNGIFHAIVTPDEIIVSVPEDITSSSDKLIIYPNPMEIESRIKFPNKNNSPYRLVVVDASGRVVRIIENITNNNITINREQLKPGIHIINLEGEKIFKGKLLVK